MKHLRIVANCAQHAPPTTPLSLMHSLLALLSINNNPTERGSA